MSNISSASSVSSTSYIQKTINFCSDFFAKIIEVICRIANRIFSLFSSSSNSSLKTAQPVLSSNQTATALISPKLQNLINAHQNGDISGVGLSKLKEFEKNGNFNSIRSSHYDWWLFPIDRDSSSKGSSYTLAQADFEFLSKNSIFMANYCEGIKIVLSAWGWDADKCKDISGSGKVWDGYGIRLAKMANSIILFRDNCNDDQKKAELSKIFKSVQMFYKSVVLPVNNAKNNCQDFNLVKIYLDS